MYTVCICILRTVHIYMYVCNKNMYMPTWRVERHGAEGGVVGAWQAAVERAHGQAAQRLDGGGANNTDRSG